MKNTRYVKVTATFVLGYDEPLDAVPEELGAVQAFLKAGVEAAFIDKGRPNRRSVYICPYATLSAVLIHAPRAQPRVMTQGLEGFQTFLTRKQQNERALLEAHRSLREAKTRGGKKTQETQEVVGDDHVPPEGTARLAPKRAKRKRAGS